MVMTYNMSKNKIIDLKKLIITFKLNILNILS